jgi:HAAS domain-containing protein
MMPTNRHPLAERYLAELRRALADLPAYRRAELLSEIEEHRDETAPPAASDTEVADAIHRLGDPEQIAEAEREGDDVHRWALHPGPHRPDAAVGGVHDRTGGDSHSPRPQAAQVTGSHAGFRRRSCERSMLRP